MKILINAFVSLGIWFMKGMSKGTFFRMNRSEVWFWKKTNASPNFPKLLVDKNKVYLTESFKFYKWKCLNLCSTKNLFIKSKYNKN